MESIVFYAQGTPRPAGSKTAGVVYRKGSDSSRIPAINERTGSIRTYVQDSSGQRGKDWRTDVREAALEAFTDLPPLQGPLQMRIYFWMPRPKGHYRSGKHSDELRADAPVYHDKAPDVDKLSRAVLDALKGVAWIDDAQVARKQVQKAYANWPRHPGAEIRIQPIPLSE